MAVTGYMVLNDSHDGWIVGPRLASREEAERELAEHLGLPARYGTGWHIVEIRRVASQLELFEAAV